MVDWGGGAKPRRLGAEAWRCLGGGADIRGAKGGGRGLSPSPEIFFEFFAQNGTFSCILKHYF
jgi:hypothetical protein